MAAFAVGAIAFAVLLDQVGWAGLRRAVVATGTWFVVIAAIDLTSVFSDAAGMYCFVPAHAKISYWRVFAAQASGLAINRLTPGNSLGEPIKVTMLMAHLPESAAVAAIVKFNLATMYVALSLIVLGVPLTFATLDLPGRLQLAVWIGTAILVTLALALALLVRRGALGTLVDGATHLRLVSAERAARWRIRSAAIDRDVRSFGDRSSRRGIGFVIASRILFSIGSVVIMLAAEIPITPSLVIAMMSVGILITWMSNMIPLGLGLADGGNYALYGALGPSPTLGLDFTMVNRARTCILAAMGLTIMLIANLVDRDRRAASITGS